MEGLSEDVWKSSDNVAASSDETMLLSEDRGVLSDNFLVASVVSLSFSMRSDSL